MHVCATIEFFEYFNTIFDRFRDSFNNNCEAIKNVCALEKIARHTRITVVILTYRSVSTGEIVRLER